jgi:hypothetical protein
MASDEDGKKKFHFIQIVKSEDGEGGKKGGLKCIEMGTPNADQFEKRASAYVSRVGVPAASRKHFLKFCEDYASIGISLNTISKLVEGVCYSVCV